jgi:hypothetical protein
MLERLARDKHSSLLRKLVNYGRKSFINLGRCVGDEEKSFMTFEIKHDLLPNLLNLFFPSSFAIFWYSAANVIKLFSFYVRNL